MKRIEIFAIILFSLCTQCTSVKQSELTADEKTSIQGLIQKEIDLIIEAVSNKDIDKYMENMPSDFIIYDENGEVITRDKQREYVLRDWSIIDRTLSNEMHIDSIAFISRDSLYVFTSQKWERIMFRRDGITTDTVLTTQKHKELWKKGSTGWLGYNVEELGGEVFINGEKYNQQ